MKRSILLYLLLIPLSLLAQKEESHLEAPEDWRKELIEFPLSFAPEIDLKGVEDVRFAPGWSKEGADDFWTYAFLWYLDEDPKISAESLAKYMSLYFDGLMGLVAKGNDIDSSLVIKTVPRFTQTKSTGEKQYFEGQVTLFNSFFTKKPVTLNVKVTDFYCSESEKFLTLFRLSPRDIEDDIWNHLKKIVPSSDCY